MSTKVPQGRETAILLYWLALAAGAGGLLVDGGFTLAAWLQAGMLFAGGYLLAVCAGAAVKKPEGK